MSGPDDLMTVQEAARYFGIGRRLLDRLVAARIIGHAKDFRKAGAPGPRFVTYVSKAELDGLSAKGYLVGRQHGKG